MNESDKQRIMYLVAEMICMAKYTDFNTDLSNPTSHLERALSWEREAVENEMNKLSVEFLNLLNKE
jgi:hypothetical protein